jgi:hypothetical protein
MPDGRFSEDRKWWWDGKQWMSSTSADGRWEWDGTNWQPTSAVPMQSASSAAGPTSAGFLRKIPGFRSRRPRNMLLAGTGYGLAMIWLLSALASGNRGMAVFGLGAVLLAMVGFNGWGLRSRLPGVRSPNRSIAAGTWLGVFVALVIVSALAGPPPSTPLSSRSKTSSPEVASATTHVPPVQVASESTPTPTFKPTPTPTDKPSPTPLPSPSPTSTPRPAPTAAPTAPPTPVPVQPAPPPAVDTYAAATAAGATAVCADGSWSFSQNRSGTCSHHGGVHWWTGNLGPAGPGGH